MKKKAIIVSIKGTILSKKEKLLFSKEKPWGVILFKRNIKTLKQIINLTKSIRIFSKDRKFPILIDEEGNTVSRLRNIINHNIDAKFFGDLYAVNKDLAINLYKVYLKSLCEKLNKIGININTIPVLDILRSSTHKIIGRRSFSYKKEIVKKLGQITIQE